MNTNNSTLDQLQHQFTTLQQQIDQRYYQLKQIQTQDSLIQEQITQLQHQLQQDQLHLQHLSLTSDLFKTLQQQLSLNNIQHITNLINTSLQQVFDTQTTHYQIRIDLSQQRNTNTANFYLLTTQDEITTETPIQDNGFGIQSLIGFILQVYFIIQHDQAHILFLDESLTAISQDKLPKLKQLINQISTTYDFKFVLIAHMQQLFQLADYIYNVDNGTITQIPTQRKEDHQND